MELHNNIRILIAHDHTLLREGLIHLVHMEKDMEVTGQAITGPDILEALEKTPVDVLVLDLNIPDLEVLNVLLEIRHRHPLLKVLILSSCFEQDLIIKALCNGAMGYLLKNVHSNEFLKAIRAIHCGEAWVARRDMGHLLQGLSPSSNGTTFKERQASPQFLTRREVDIALLVAGGSTNKEIADELFISEKTVKCHLMNIFKKLQIRHRTQLALHVHNSPHLRRLHRC